MASDWATAKESPRRGSTEHHRRRTHADLRVLSYERAWRRVELRVGVRRVFWGVTESRHLVDVINQTDLVENPDGEDKLGQPMVNVAWLGPLGTVDFYLLAGFRQRTFPGVEGRLRFPIVVEPDRGSFASEGVARHLGWAARWFRTMGGGAGGSHRGPLDGRHAAQRRGGPPNRGPHGTDLARAFYGLRPSTRSDRRGDPVRGSAAAGSRPRAP